MQTRRTIWLDRLGLALRTTLACLVISLTTIYSPEPLKPFTKFPAFSYLTTIMILASDNDSSLGRVLKGCVHALYATFQMMGLGLLSLTVIGPARLSTGLVAAAAVALNSFIVAFPDSTSLLAKRIAFGQIVILYVALVVTEGDTVNVVMHPVHVAGSTVLGALASLMAMLILLPRLSHNQMRNSCRVYAENVSERLNLIMEASIARDNTVAQALITRVGSLSAKSRTLLQSIKLHNEGIKWERPDIRFLRQKKDQTDLVEKMQRKEILMRGMELALSSCSSFPIYTSHEELKHSLESCRSEISNGNEKKDEPTRKLQWHHEVDPLSLPNLSICFLWYCVELFRGETLSNSKYITTKEESNHGNKGSFMVKTIRVNLIDCKFKEKLIFAFKCSISLGLAVLFGLMYNKEHEYWSGLTIAISLSSGRQASFSLANARLQGTVMGSVYSLLCCSVFHKLEEFRFLPLLPWIVFTFLLKYSRMYGQAGGVSAAIGALLILGRRHYGAPTEFAIARIVEVSIGLLCLIFTELMFNPVRAATLAKTELSHCLVTLLDCIQSLVLRFEQTNKPTDLRNQQAKLKYHVNTLEKFIAEAESEPNFWFRPFNAICYKELSGSFSKIADLCLHVSNELENLFSVQPIFGSSAFEELQDHISHDLKTFKEKLDFSVKSFEEIIKPESLARFQKELQKRKISHDTEAGTQSNNNSKIETGLNQDEVESFLRSFLLLLKETAEKISRSKTEEILKNKTILCLSSLGFCISKMMQETIAIITKGTTLLT